MAEALPEAGASFHGVLHLMSPEDMAKLDKIEASYIRNTCIAVGYDGKAYDCTVYSRVNVERGPDKDKAPTERYLDIMIEGCKHFGVKQSYIDFLQNHDKQPRKKPEEYLKLEVPGDLPTMSDADIASGNGKDGNKLLFTCNGKVYEYTADKEGPFGKIWMGAKASGKNEIEVTLSGVMYDPKYGVITKKEQVTRDCAANYEDQMATWKSFGDKSWVMVGLFDQKYPD